MHDLSNVSKMYGTSEYTDIKGIIGENLRLKEENDRLTRENTRLERIVFGQMAGGVYMPEGAPAK